MLLYAFVVFITLMHLFARNPGDPIDYVQLILTCLAFDASSSSSISKDVLLPPR